MDRMNCRSSDLSGGLGDHGGLRSIWEDRNWSPSSTSSSCGSSSLFASLQQNRSHLQQRHSVSQLENLGSLQKTYSGLTGSSLGAVGTPSPMGRSSLGGYESSGSVFGSASNIHSNAYSSGSSGGSSPKYHSPTSSSSSGFMSHRNSISSLWDQSSGYSSGASNSLFSPTESSSPSGRGFGGTFFDRSHLPSYEQDRDQQENNERIDMLSRALSCILNSRATQHMTAAERTDSLKELLGLNNRRASVAASGGMALERERHSMGNRSNGFMGSDDSALLMAAYGNSNSSSSLFSTNQTPYEIALERIEREAKMRRTSAYQTDTSFTWKGTLTTRFHSSPTYATKVFVGGLPYDVTPEALTDLFGKFGLISVQFPPRGRGHAYLVFDTEQQVQTLLSACENKGPGQFFYWVASRRGKDRQAQVIPWATEDSDWLADSSSSSSVGSAPSSPSSPASSRSGSLDSLLDEADARSPGAVVPFTRRPHDSQSSSCKQNTVFVGALHGEITAEGLQKILSELFGPVVHVGIDTDKNRYPNGSARVTFASRESFHKAVLAEFVQVVSPRFSKTIQLDAYIEDGICSECKISTPVFCRHPKCFRYYCPLCFEDHRRFNTNEYHPPVMRNRNNNYIGSNNGLGRNAVKDRSQTV